MARPGGFADVAPSVVGPTVASPGSRVCRCAMDLRQVFSAVLLPIDSGRTSAATFIHNEAENSVWTAICACVSAFEVYASAVDDNSFDGIVWAVDEPVVIDDYA